MLSNCLCRCRLCARNTPSSQARSNTRAPLACGPSDVNLFFNSWSQSVGRLACSARTTASGSLTMRSAMAVAPTSKSLAVLYDYLLSADVV